MSVRYCKMGSTAAELRESGLMKNDSVTNWIVIRQLCSVAVALKATGDSSSLRDLATTMLGSSDSEGHWRSKVTTLLVCSVAEPGGLR